MLRRTRHGLSSSVTHHTIRLCPVLQVLHAVSSGKLLQLPLAAPGAFRELVQQALDPEAARR
jgi:hypothetical protein